MHSYKDFIESNTLAFIFYHEILIFKVLDYFFFFLVKFRLEYFITIPIFLKVVDHLNVVSAVSINKILKWQVLQNKEHSKWAREKYHNPQSLKGLKNS